MHPVQRDVTTGKDSESLSVLGPAAGGLAGAVAAMFAALCCVGPSTVALLGAGGAVAAATLSPYRPVFLLASLALIGFGFWRLYARRGVSADGRACPVRVGRLARSILWASAAVWLAAALLPMLLG
jgi:mercuric ion transport protein